MPDGELLYLGMDALLSTPVVGDYIADHGLAEVPVVQPVLGGEEDGSRFATRSLVQTTLGTDRCVEHDRAAFNSSMDYQRRRHAMLNGSP